MFFTEGTCPNCGESIKVHFGQSAKHWCPGLGWWEAYHCEHCGSAVQADGGEDMPEHYRRQMIEREGLWQIASPDNERVSVALLKGLRAVLQLSLSDVAQLKRDQHSEFAEGTKAEMEHLQNLLANEGVQVVMRRAHTQG